MNTKLIFSLCFMLLAGVGVSYAQTIDVEKSTVSWVGKKIAGQHSGTIMLSEGHLHINDAGAITGGDFVIDMNSLKCTDLQGDYAGKLEGHLKSDDFFGTATFPTASLKITGVDGDEVSGDLTIKAITEPVTFKIVPGEGGLTANISVDRTKYDIKYGSGKFFDSLGDNMIHDNFELNVVLMTKM